jgi:hypothetical protein
MNAIKLTSMLLHPQKEKVYVIRKLEGDSPIGLMWSEIERGSLEEMKSSINSKKYNNFKKIIEL